LYYPNGTAIHAVADGKVIAGPYSFYAQTYSIEVDHGSFIVRYGEVQSATNVSVGMSVTKGQKIAKVGHLVGISVPSDMLHLEMYSKSASGSLTVTNAANSKKRNDGIPFFRRSDLIDPTSYLNQWKNNLPDAV
jgi:murein DD-endopeptidase MepM/ murein hydrolase activator NlpD